MQPANATWPIGIEYAVLSDIGLRRANNQDSYAVALAASAEGWSTRGHLFQVADGMGAHAAGELASKLSTDTVPQTYRKLVDQAPNDALRNAIDQANEVIHTRGASQPEFHGMGTTTSALALLPQGAFVAHVGDSRVYRLRGDTLEQLSFDHSLVWEMIASGQITEDHVPPYIPKNVITRSLGPSSRVEIDCEGPFPLQMGDTFLLCSDGLSGQVNDEEIGAILGALSAQDAARALVDLANLRGGPDNVTVVVVRVTGDSVLGGGMSHGARYAARPGAGAQATLFWVLPAVTAALALALGAGGQMIGAAAAGVVTALVIIVGLALRGRNETPVPEAPTTPLGKAPYRTRNCTPDRPFVDRLAETVEQVRQAAAEQKFNVDWATFQQREGLARTAVAKRDYRAAVRAYCETMSFLMNELRRQRAKPEA